MSCLNCGTHTPGTYCPNCTAYARQEGVLPVVDDPESPDAREPGTGLWIFNWRSRAR